MTGTQAGNGDHTVMSPFKFILPITDALINALDLADYALTEGTFESVVVWSYNDTQTGVFGDIHVKTVKVDQQAITIEFDKHSLMDLIAVKTNPAPSMSKEQWVYKYGRLNAQVMGYALS